MAVHHLSQQNLEHFLRPSIVDLVQQGHNHLMFVVLQKPETFSTKRWPGTYKRPDYHLHRSILGWLTIL